MSQPAASIRDRAEALAGQLPPLMVAAERVAATVSQGVHGRRRVGQGETFWQFRRYQPGDATQRIDWRQSAKSQPVYIRETEWEAAQSVWVWRDGSPSMAFRSKDALPTKRDRAELLMLALAALLLRGGEHVAALGSGVSPGGGRGTLLRMTALLEAGALPADSLPALERLPRYGRLALFGDFLAPLDDIRAAIERFASRGIRGHLMQIMDPAEETLPYGGRIQFEGPEADGRVLIGRVEGVRQDYLGALARHRAGIAALAAAVGWSFAVHHTDRTPESALLALYMTLSADLAQGRGLARAGGGR